MSVPPKKSIAPTGSLRCRILCGITFHDGLITSQLTWSNCICLAMSRWQSAARCRRQHPVKGPDPNSLRLRRIAPHSRMVRRRRVQSRSLAHHHHSSQPLNSLSSRIRQRAVWDGEPCALSPGSTFPLHSHTTFFDTSHLSQRSALAPSSLSKGLANWERVVKF